MNNEELNDLQRIVKEAMDEYNHQQIIDFEGYSPYEMQYILYYTFGPDSPIQLRKINDSDFIKIPIFNQIKYVLEFIEKKGEIKLTSKGNFPVNLVKEIYSQGFIKDKKIEKGFVKLYKETDSIPIHLTHILIKLSGLVIKRQGKLYLTKNYEKYVSDNNELLKLIFITFANKFNWSYFDRYGENNIGQLGFGFSLILLSKYGNEKRTDTFYAEKYFKAFPILNSSIVYHKNDSSKETANRCYSLRTFDRFLNYFGIIDVIYEGIFNEKKYITKTTLFDKLIYCKPHKL